MAQMNPVFFGELDFGALAYDFAAGSAVNLSLRFLLMVLDDGTLKLLSVGPLARSSRNDLIL